MPASLLAVSELHVRHPANRAIVEELRPASDGDWLIVAGDVAERVDDVVGTLALLRERFATVGWTPGNHELWTRARAGVLLGGEDVNRGSGGAAASRNPLLRTVLPAPDSTG